MNLNYLLLVAVLLGIVKCDYEPRITIDHSKDMSRDMGFFDDSPNILSVKGEQVYLSTDYGEKWNKVSGIDEKIIFLQFDEFKRDRAFAISVKKKHYLTEDKGLTWKSMELDIDNSNTERDSLPRILLNSKDPNLALIAYYHCPRGERCTQLYYYTSDGFKTSPKKLGIDASTCEFAKSSKAFENGGVNTIYCAQNKLNSFGHVVESVLYKSDDFFKTKTTLNHNFSKSGKVIDIRVHQNFVIAVVQNDKFNTRSKVTLLISKDGDNFQPSDLQVDIAYGVMTFLDSSPSSLFLSVADYNSFFHQSEVATIYSSDSSGLRMTKVLDHVEAGMFQKVQTIDGVWMANLVGEKESDNDHDNDDKDPSIIDLILSGNSVSSKISFNDGKDWQDLKVADDEACDKDKECSLHLLTSVEVDGEGKFVTGPTPGILMGVGNTGKKLHRDIKKLSTYISRDGGSTWTKAIKEPCQFTFGDLGNVILAVPYFGNKDMSTNSIYYSLDQGMTFQKQKLETAFFPLNVLTTIDGTSTHFLVEGMIDDTPDNHKDFKFSRISYAIDFSKAYDGKKCGKGDFEEIYARVSSDDKSALCIYGHREKFRRRKADAKCFAATLFEDVTVYDEACDCTEVDFECAPGFKPTKDNGCEPDKRAIVEMCSNTKSKELKLPDKVLVDGNECSMGKKSIKNFVSEHTLKCSDYVDKADTHKELNKAIVTTKNMLESNMKEYVYFEQERIFNGENILIRTDDNRLYASRDGGVEFVKVPVHEQIIAYFMGLVPGHIILATGTERNYISYDAGSSYSKIDTPAPPSPLAMQVVAFHKKTHDKFIWFGSTSTDQCKGVDRDDKFNEACRITAYITDRRGRSFETLRDDVIKCDFVQPFLAQDNETYIPEDLIFCSVLDKQKRTLNLISSSDMFKTETVVAENIVGYAISGNFIVVGKIDEEANALKALITVDGETFAEASVPHDSDVDIKQAFTILDSEKGAIFMHVTTRSDSSLEYGSVLKSNSNGTSYALSLDHVNRNREGYVDYDRIQGIEGILIANIVDNFDSKDAKKLKTKISHNDGGEWNYIAPPAVDSKKKKYACNGKSLQECSLNLHSFTERADYRDTFGSSAAVGIMIGIGNVGPHLTDKKDASTFLTTDGGVTWREIKKGVHMWEYGDRGSILVLVKEGETDTLLYSLDEGHKWINYKFTDKKVKILDLATVPSDNSRKFVIFTESEDTTVTFTIDFTNIYKRQCQLNLDNPDNDDFEYWSPKHPSLSDNCLFGHEAKYLRRAKGRDDCFIGSAPITDGFKVIRNCSCTRKDYECDYNYFRDGNDDTCKLVKGLSPSDHLKEMCKNNVFEYFEPTGYRKIPLSTCVAGKQFDSLVPKPCPGKESEFNKYYGREVGFGKLLLILGIPLCVFLFVTWFVYDRGIRRNGGFKQFGQIRLDGEEDDLDFQPIENNEVDKVVNSIVKGGILAVATVIATVRTIRKFDKMMFEKLTSQIFRGRTGRRSYVSVPDDFDDDEELFGNFQDNYEQELSQGGDGIYRDFTDEADPITDEAGIAPEPVEDSNNADSRLFEVDDHSDDES